MISRVESGQVSPSIATLGALADALDVPLVTLLRGTGTMRADFTHVRAGEGLRSTRILGRHAHDFVNLAYHARHDIQFEARLVTLRRQDARSPAYVGHGVVFVQVLSGEAVYLYCGREIEFAQGDSLSVDAELAHGFHHVVTDEVRFLTVQSERRP